MSEAARVWSPQQILFRTHAYPISMDVLWRTRYDHYDCLAVQLHMALAISLKVEENASNTKTCIHIIFWTIDLTSDRFQKQLVFACFLHDFRWLHTKTRGKIHVFASFLKPSVNVTNSEPIVAFRHHRGNSSSFHWLFLTKGRPTNPKNSLVGMRSWKGPVVSLIQKVSLRFSKQVLSIEVKNLACMDPIHIPLNAANIRNFL